MKSVVAVVIIVAAAAAPALAAEPAGAEMAIQKLWAEFSNAWARGDAAARASLWAEDGSLINPFGVAAHGRVELQKVFEQEDAGFAKGTTNTLSDFSFRFLTPAIAAVDATGEVKGIRAADGTQMPAFTIHVFSIAVKTGGKWLIKDARPYAFAPRPGPATAAAK